MGDVVDDVQARHVAAVEQEYRMALLLAEDRDQHIGDADFLFAARLHVEHRPLQHALEAERRLHLALLAFLELRGRLVDVLLQLLLEFGEVGSAGAQHFAHLGRVEDRQEQVLDREVLVTRLTRLVERIVQTVFELVGQHLGGPFKLSIHKYILPAIHSQKRRFQASSNVHMSGCWWSRA